MRVIKRDGTAQPLNFEKIHWRIKALCAKPEIKEFQRRERPESYDAYKKLNELPYANYDQITLKTIQGLYNNVRTTEIDILSSEIAQGMVTIHPDNSILAKRILVSNIQKNTLEFLIKRFPQVPRDIIRSRIFYYSMLTLYNNLNKKGEQSPLVAPYVLAVARQNPHLEDLLDFSRDFTNHDYLGIKILEKGYLLRLYDPNISQGIVIERPSVSSMRIAIGIHCAPTPYEKWYQADDVKHILRYRPHVIKYARRLPESIDIIMSSVEPHKHPWLNLVTFSEEYWAYMLSKETGIINREISSSLEDTYNMMTTGKYTPATPTRFNMGTLKPQGSSCFLLAMEDDSLTGIYNTLAKQAQISKYAGGVGMWVSNIRSSGSYIAGTNGVSNGLASMLGLFNSSARYVDQGGGKRPGTVAVYLELWHADILSFLELKRNQGLDSARARSLFFGLWVSDEFFRCLKSGKDWYLFDPAVVPKLYSCYDEGFSKKYLSDEYLSQNKSKFLFTYRYRKYIRQGKYEKIIKPSYLIEEIVKTIKDAGVPYIMTKDSCNRKSNQKNLGVIRGSNLCTEIIEYSGKNENGDMETAVCNLSSISLNKFVKELGQTKLEEDDVYYNVSLDPNVEKRMMFDFQGFANTVRRVVKNLNRTIDVNFYPTDCTERSNFRHRPMGIGVQSESDLMAILRLPWDSQDAHELRFRIFEQLYYTCLETSSELAAEYGPYETFSTSPASEGKLSHDLWLAEGRKLPFDLTLDWDKLKRKISISGLRNSLFVAPMPTASTSGILGNSPCFEPFNSLIYNRKVGAGEVTMVNNYLVRDLLELGLWSPEMSDKILSNKGSIQNIHSIPSYVRSIYKTAYDMSYEDIIKAASHRAWFVDQSQSMNLFVDNVTIKTLTRAWTMGWSKGLKTLSYYIRTLPSVEGQKITVQKESEVCSRDNPDCMSCGS